ncbi:hypothetical protein BH23PLA1_BH23PLA1_15150 [soil metagenome]
MLANLKRISMVTGLLAVAMTFTGTAPAQELATSANQATANAVASALGSCPALQGYRIAIDVRDGMVTLNGAVSNPQEHAEVIEHARQAPGVVAVIDYVRVVSDAAVVPVQYQVAHGGLGGHGHGHSAGPIGGSMRGGFEGAPSNIEGGMMGGEAGMSGPLPEGPAGMGGSQASMPGYPNYAWPSYAPYPNFSAVGYPTAYPWQAWPNIGPIHPYPEVPLDWRAVTLRWKDGIWFLDFKKHYTRPFFTPYPFGLFAY